MRALRLPFLALLLAALAACDSGPGGSLYDPDVTGDPAPVISSVTPDDVVLAGIDEITITGQNFSATPEHNIVYFDDAAGAVAQGTVLSASPTQLRVRVPNTPNPNLRVRVAVRGAPDFSNAVPLALTPAFVPFGGLDTGTRDEVFGMTSDSEGRLFASYTRGGSATGIVEISPDGEQSVFFPNSFIWSDLALTDDGALIGARRLRALFNIPALSPPFVVLSNGVTLSALTTDPSGNVWTGGSNAVAANASIYRVAPDGTATAFPFDRPIRDLVVFDGALYAATATTTTSSVWRFPIDANGDLGAGSIFYNVSEDRGASVQANAIAFAEDGTLFVGTNATDPIVEVAPDGTPSVLYPGVLRPPVSGFAWGPGSQLYVSVAAGFSPSPDIPGTPAGLIRLETRRQGSR